MSYIDTYKRTSDWIACRNGNKTQWESGKTEKDAIDKLIVSFPDMKNARVMYQGEDHRAEATALIMNARLFY